MIYLDNGATSWPKPESVYREMDHFFRNYCGNPGRASHQFAVHSDTRITECRHSVARFFNCPEPDRIVFTYSATDGLNLVIKGLLKPGDHVITSHLEHNSVVRPLEELRPLGVETDYIVPDENGQVGVELIEQKVKKNTRLICITCASNVTGILQPVKKICAYGKSAGILTLLDASQTAGIIPLDLSETRADFVVFPGHKALFGPPGTGAIIVNCDTLLTPFRSGGTGRNSELLEQPDSLPHRYESGTLNSVGITGLAAGIAFINKEGLDTIHNKEKKLSGQLLEGLAKLKGITVYAGLDPELRTSVISFNAENWDCSLLGATLEEYFQIASRSGLHCAPKAHQVLKTFPEGALRISPGYFTTEEDIDTFLFALKKVTSG